MAGAGVVNDSADKVQQQLNASTVMTKCKRPLEIIFRNLEFSVDIPQPFEKKRISNLYKKPPFMIKKILKGVSGEFLPGRLTAVMGASGAGKTSMLQVLAAEGHNGTVGGHVYVNGEAIYGKQMKNISGFVFQDDLILSTMTVREAITMSAQLRLPTSVSQAERKARIEEVLLLMNLDRCQNTIIGNPTEKGVSGGERKRCAIAMELITNPTILFLDEPTSGLDAFTAYSVIKNLKTLAEHGKTVIATIHQPSAEIFFLFDDLLLMADGGIMYHGPIRDTVDYFQSIGYDCPKNTNPSDWLFMTILNNEEASEVNPYAKSTGDNGAPNPASTETNNERVSRLLKVWATGDRCKRYESRSLAPSFSKNNAHLALTDPETDAEDSDESGGSISEDKMPGFLRQFMFLFKRASKNTFRNPLMMRARTSQTIAIGVIIGLVYLNTQNRAGQAGIQDRNGLLFFVNMNAMLSTCVAILSVFITEKLVFDREYNAHYYQLPAYFFSKVCVEAPLNLVGPLMMYIIIYFMSGLYRSAAQFFIFLGVVFLVNISGFGLGFTLGSIFSSLPVALAVAPSIILPLAIFSGLFAGSAAMPAYFRWIQYLSPIKYGFESLVKNEYMNGDVRADPPLYPNPIPGSAVVESLGMSGDIFSIGVCVAFLLLLIIVMFSISYIGLYRIVQKSSKGLIWICADEIRQQRRIAKLEEKKKMLEGSGYNNSKLLSCAPVFAKPDENSHAVVSPSNLSTASADNSVSNSRGSEDIAEETVVQS